ncbi:MAG TPA: chemotaxis-specific protein-glutamate methyltransferase CheB [Nannocystaceae bacterium]|nr:chemotaxis-specific protein-glutamate methyltransferase CheB [Nannocystaceae bacterium]
MTRVRVLVVEDSLTVRRWLCDALARDPGLEIVGEAEDGKRAIELCQELRPDVVTLDMMLPVMTGIAATEYIMAYCPTPILVVSASTNRGELFRTYDALAAGAVDVLEKPTGTEDDAEWARKFVDAVKLAAKIRVITHPRARLRAMAPTARDAPPRTDRAPSIVAIGTSTGGPAALVQILAALPADYPIPLVGVIHLADLFAVAFAEWLDGQSKHRVRYARDGEVVGGPGLVLAPADRHLAIVGGRFRLTMDPPRHSCRPSVDTLFESIATEYGASATACLLTGMGKDGARGLLAIRRRGGFTIAQDEASSVIYGMPREAVELGAAERVLPLDEIAATLARLAKAERTP